MTVPAQIPVTPFAGDGATKVFAFAWRADSTATVLVQVNGQQAVQGVDFVVEGATVRFMTPPAAGVLGAIYRRSVDAQAKSFPNTASLKPGSIEDAHDQHVLAIQELRAQQQSAVSSPIGEAGQVLPSRASLKGKFVYGDPVTGALSAAPGAITGLPASDFGASLIGGSALDASGKIVVQAAVAGAVQRTLSNKMLDSINVRDFGAKGDGRVFLTASMAAGSNVLNATPLNYFQASDVGKRIAVEGAAGGGRALYATITKINSQTQAVLSAAAVATVANGTGSIGTDDTAAFNLASVAAYILEKTIEIPPGYYVLTGTWDTYYVAGISGAGVGRCVLDWHTETAMAIRLRQVDHITTTYYSSVVVRGMTLFRTGKAQAGADGLVCDQYLQNPVLCDLVLLRHYHNLVLGPTDAGFVSNVTAMYGQGHGIYCTGNAANNVCQWLFFVVNACQNVKRGVCLDASNGPVGSPMLTKEIIYLGTYANGEGGLAVLGDPAGNGRCFSSLRLYNSFFGEDGGDLLFMDDRAPDTVSHFVSCCYFEIAGTRTTGPDFSIPRSNAGNGIRVANSQASLQISTARLNGNSENGIALLSAGRVTLINVETTNNSQGVANNYHGVYVGTVTSLTYIGGAANNRSGGTTQRGGLLVADGSKVVIEGVEVSPNTTYPIYFTANGSSARLRNNKGYVSEASGTVTGTPSGTGDLTINHGLSATPVRVVVTITGTAFAVPVVVAKTASTATVRLFGAGGATITSGTYSLDWAATTQS